MASSGGLLGVLNVVGKASLLDSFAARTSLKFQAKALKRPSAAAQRHTQMKLEQLRTPGVKVSKFLAFEKC